VKDGRPGFSVMPEPALISNAFCHTRCGLGAKMIKRGVSELCPCHVLAN